MNDLEKINYIKNNFHQYVELTLNTNIKTTEAVNLVIPFDTLTEGNTIISNDFSHNIDIFHEYYNIEEILQKYNDIICEDKTPCFCKRVIDGDTIEVKIPYKKEENVVSYNIERIRLVGINTPEIETQNGEEIDNGARISKEFLEKICFSEEYLNGTSETNTKKIYLKIDNQKTRDKYNRLLAVLIVDNKNINEILLKEGLAEIMYIPPSEFNPYLWGDINTPVAIYEFENSDISVLYPYFNSEMTNIVFTPKNDYETIYKFEVYKNMIYVRLNPYSKQIIMHLLPKYYDCSNNLLIFKDEMIQDNNINITNDYYHYPEKDFINAYYQTNMEDRDRTNPDISGDDYDSEDWNYNTFCDFSYDISNSTKNFNNLQINAGYRYNNSTPYYSVHYTGVRDYTSFTIEDRCTLVDANYDGITASNNITQHHYNENSLYIPKPDDSEEIYAYADIDRLNDIDWENYDSTMIGSLHHKTIKYINDSMYAEEEGYYKTVTWKDLSEQ